MDNQDISNTLRHAILTARPKVTGGENNYIFVTFDRDGLPRIWLRIALLRPKVNRRLRGDAEPLPGEVVPPPVGELTRIEISTTTPRFLRKAKYESNDFVLNQNIRLTEECMAVIYQIKDDAEDAEARALVEYDRAAIAALVRALADYTYVPAGSRDS